MWEKIEGNRVKLDEIGKIGGNLENHGKLGEIRVNWGIQGILG